MRIERRDWRGAPDCYALFEAGEIPGLMREHASHIRGGSWHGDTIENMRRKSETGDNSLVKESDRFLTMIEDQIPVSQGWRAIDDVVGGVPNVPAFLAGHPMHMRRRVRVAKESAPLTVFADLTSSASISAKDVGRRAVVLLALVRLLVEHRPVELWVGTAKGMGRGSGCAAWRIDTAPLDLARSAYHIGSAAMARGFGYGMTDSLFRTGGHWPFHSFEMHKRTAVERLRGVFGFGDVLYVPPIFEADPLVADPVGWLKRTMKQYIGGEEE